MDLIIKNGTVVTEKDVFKADVGILSGKIVSIADKIENGGQVIDAKGKYVMPAGVEVHTHIRAPLFNMVTVDDWYDASIGAAFGGTATVIDYIMQDPAWSLRQTIEEYAAKAKGKSIVDYSFSPIISQWKEETFEEIPGLIEDGTTNMFKAFLYYQWRVNDYDLAHLLDLVSSRGGIVGFHCENAGTIDYLVNKALSEGKVEARWHGETRPVSSELEAVSRVIYIAGEMGAPAYIVHISAGPVMDQLAEAKARGVKVYGEGMPHYLCLDDSMYEKPGHEPMKAVITPPIRPKEHQEPLWQGLRSNLLSVIGSDHCAFPFKDKIRLYNEFGQSFAKIPHGAPGIETRMPIVFSEGVQKGRISLQKFVEVMCSNPARIAGVYPRKGSMHIGSDADITIFDPEKEKVMKAEDLHGKTDFTPFEGFLVKGWPVMTMRRGEILVQDDKVIAEPGSGQQLKRDKFMPF